MTVGIVIGNGTTKSILEHSSNTTLELTTASELLVESPLTPIIPDMLVANTCTGVQNLIIQPELKQQVWDNLGVVDKPTINTLYSLFNSKEFGDWLEVDYGTGLMNRDIGPKVGFMTGLGFKVENVTDAIPNLSKIKEFLISINYRGEVLLGISSNFEVTDIVFGHAHAHFGMYNELYTGKDSGGMLDFIFEKLPTCKLYADTGALANVVSLQPFPVNIPNQAKKIQAPASAEKHLWRIHSVNLDYVIIIVQGSYLGEARKRLNRTIENMLSYNNELQYRTDYGYDRKFVLSSERYKKFQQFPYEKKVEKV